MSSPELSSAGTIPYLVNAVLQRVRQAAQLLIDSKARSIDKKIVKEQIQLQNALLKEQTAVIDYFNHYILVLGVQFSTGDDDAIRELRMIYDTLPQDVVEVEELGVEEEEVEEEEVEEEEVEEEEVEEEYISDSERMEYTRELKSIISATKTVIQELANRKGYFTIKVPSQHTLNLREQVRKLFPSHDCNAGFCEGALHLYKHPSAALSAVASRQPSGGGYVCNHCGLDLTCMEINQTGTISFNRADWRMLAACHIQAHFSFQNLAAWYLCRICHDRGVTPPEVFISPVAMMEHLANH